MGRWRRRREWVRGEQPLAVAQRILRVRGAGVVDDGRRRSRRLVVVVLMLLRASDTNIAGELYVALAFSRT